MISIGGNRDAPEDAKLYDPLEWATIALRARDLATAFDEINRWLVRGGLERTAFACDANAGDSRLPSQDRKLGVLISDAFEDHLCEHPDPNVKAASRLSNSERLAPTIFGHPDSDMQIDSRGADVMTSFGFKGGFSASFFSSDRSTNSTFLCCSLTSTRDVTEIYDVHGRYIRDAFAFFNEGRLLREVAEREPPILSRRESECLLWAALGKTTQQIADRLNINDRTVDEYIANATRKLNASSRTQACARAIMLSLISP